MLRKNYYKLRNIVRNHYLNYIYSKKNKANVKGNLFSAKSFNYSEIEIGEYAVIVGNKLSGNIKLGPYTWIYDSILNASRDNKIDIGGYTLIQGGGSQFVAKHRNIKIGKFCTIGFGSAVIAFSHRSDTYTTSFLDKRLNGGRSKNSISFGQIEIGHDCMIGLYSFIAPRVKLGNGCIVLPNSVVTSSFEAYSIIAGNPAVKIGERFNKTQIDYLNELNWYEWEHNKIMDNLDTLLKRVNVKNCFVD